MYGFKVKVGQFYTAKLFETETAAIRAAKRHPSAEVHYVRHVGLGEFTIISVVFSK